MATFQAFAVRGKTGPVVTLHAGVDFAGYFWTTTSRSEAKVTALLRDPIASVLSRKHDSWMLRAGRAVVVDPARPCGAIRELPVFALAGTALALIAAAYPDQLVGYAADGASTAARPRVPARRHAWENPRARISPGAATKHLAPNSADVEGREHCLLSRVVVPAVSRHLLVVPGQRAVLSAHR